MKMGHGRPVTEASQARPCSWTLPSRSSPTAFLKFSQSWPPAQQVLYPGGPFLHQREETVSAHLQGVKFPKEQQLGLVGPRRRHHTNGTERSRWASREKSTSGSLQERNSSHELSSTSWNPRPESSWTPGKHRSGKLPRSLEDGYVSHKRKTRERIT